MTNPYNKPAASVEPVATFENGLDPDAATFQPEMFSTRGRIGRVRYFAYSMAMQFLAFLGLGIAGALLLSLVGKDDPALAVNVTMGLGFAVYAALLIIAFVLIKRRLNDLDHTGWLSLLLLVPLVNVVLALYAMLWPGSAGHNNYGPKPVPNPVALTLFVTVILMLTILAGIAVMTYVSSLSPGNLPLPSGP